MDKKIIKIPITYEQRKRNEKGKGYIPCQISGRYLKLNLEHSPSNPQEWINGDVMTEDTVDGNDKVLCHMIIKKQDIIDALNEISLEEPD